MSSPDPKAFYDGVMTEKLGHDYESARWRNSPLQAAQYAMTAWTIQHYALPVLARAKRMLETGPGPGTWTKLLLTANPDASYTLVDISSAMLAQARAALPADAHISFVESDLLSFVSEQPFDGFFSSRAIEYMADKHAAALKIFSLLAPGAHGALITKTPKPLFDRARGRNVPALHQGQVAPSALTAALTSAGFEVVAVRAATATVPGFGSALLNRLCFSLIRRLPLGAPLSLFTESYCVVFRKP